MDPNPGMPVTRKKHVAIERLWDGHFPITCGLLRYRILTYSRRLGAMAALQTELGWVKIGQKSKLYNWCLSSYQPTSTKGTGASPGLTVRLAPVHLALFSWMSLMPWVTFFFESGVLARALPVVLESWCLKRGNFVLSDQLMCQWDFVTRSLLKYRPDLARCNSSSSR